jgi:hypothetical protein
MGTSIPTIRDQAVEAWIAGMPSLTDEIIMVSLLGRKPNGLSEFSLLLSWQFRQIRR